MITTGRSLLFTFAVYGIRATVEGDCDVLSVLVDDASVKFHVFSVCWEEHYWNFVRICFARDLEFDCIVVVGEDVFELFVVAEDGGGHSALFI
jgi:hypothetical protein